MKKMIVTLIAVMFCSIFFSITVTAKPDKVDGINVPSGRIPQEIKNNKYPRTYYPNTEWLTQQFRNAFFDLDEYPTLSI